MEKYQHIPHPMQPLYLDEHGRARFRPNEIVEYLFNSGKLNLNDIACMQFKAEDRMQLAQLLGYTVDGYGELSYVTDESYDAAVKAMDGLAVTD